MAKFFNNFLDRVKKDYITYIIKGAAIVLAIVPLFYVLNNAAFTRGMPEEYLPCGLCLIAGALVMIASCFVPEGKIVRYLELIATILISVAFVMFILSSILSVIDVMYKIVMWGDPAQFGSIITFGTIILLSMGSGIYLCFTK